MQKRLFAASAITAAVMLTSQALSSATSGGGTVFAAAQAPAQHDHSDGTPPATAPPAQPTMPMADMMKRHDRMMADMKASEARLDQLVQEMSTATGDARIPAIVKVVTELAAQQKTMHGEMAMHAQMMPQMMPMMGARGSMMNK